MGEHRIEATKWARWWTGAVILALGGLRAAEAEAKPVAPRLFCDAYPEHPECNGALVTCETCHASTDPVAWNPYGLALLTALAGDDFDTGLAAALRLVEDADSDGDGATNLDELQLGTNPGRAESLWNPIPTPTGTSDHYDLGAYDVAFAYRRAMVLYCGRSPSYDDLAELRALDDDAAAARLHDDLAACLDAPYWRATGLRELADPKVKPIKSVGADTTVIIQDFKVVLADYHWDYRLWRYLMADDRDMRALLTAQYHVVEDPQTGLLSPVEGTIPRPDPLAIDGGQPLEPEHRAGMLTTQWFLMSNTMFSELPRTTAAQAYRAYLGMDISKHEGIWPVAGEPADVDDRGVDAPACAQCHSTLDPLAYVFASYEGIILEGGKTGTYDPERPSALIASWDDAPRSSTLFGAPIDSVVDWGRAASDSPAFARAMTMTLYTHALGRAPTPDEAAAFSELVDTLAADGYSANRLIHRIVDTEGFGTP